MNIKKIIVSAAAAIMLSVVPLLTPVSASAETITLWEAEVCEIGYEMLTSSDGEYGYYVDSTLNIAVIGGYNGSATTVNVPAAIDGYPVIGILNGAFFYNSTITRVVIPEGIEFVGADFQGNHIGAFEGCTNLAYITLPDSLWHIGYRAFTGTGLRSVTLPESVFQIASEAFADCTALTTVRLPEGISDIYQRCFKGCTSLRSINIPSTVVNIWGEAFAGCTSLSSVVFPESLTMDFYGQYFSNINYNYSSHSTPSSDHSYCCQFKGCTSLRSVTLPDSMQIIPDGMFANSGLTNIKIGSNTTYLGADAFDGCTFSNLYIPDSVENLSVDGDSNYLRCAVTNKFSYKFNNNAISLNYPGGVYPEQIEQRGWVLTKYFDSGETDRYNYKIYNYHVYVENGIEEVYTEDYLVNVNGNLKLFLPDTVTRILGSGNSIYYYNTTNEITLGGGVIDIQDGALDYIKNLIAIHVSKAGRYSSYDGILYSDGGTTLVKFPSYYKQNDYTEIRIPYGTTTIADGAFFAVNNFDKTTQKEYKLYIPETVASIGENNFVCSTPAEIHGKPGSAAERFANAHNITFVSTDDTSDTEKYDYTETVISKQEITCDNTNFTQPTFSGSYGEVTGTLVYTDNYGSVMTYEGVRAMLANYRSGTYTIGYCFTPDSDSVYGGVKTGTITLDMTKIPVSAPVVTITAESSRVLLSWAAVDEAIAYEINLMDGDSFVKVGDTTQTSFAYTDVTENESYSFLVRAYDGDTFSDYTKEDIVTAIVKTDNPLGEVSVAGHSLILADNIGVNFYMTLPEEILNDSETYMKFSLPNGFVSRVFISEAMPETIDGKTCYKFPCFVAAAEMTDTITARLYYRGECSEEYTYSVDEYAQSVLENPERYTDTVPVVKAMLNYGSRAQEFFGHNTECLANELLPAEERAVTEAADIDLSAYKPAVTDNDSDLSFKGMVISLKSRIGLKLYFDSERELALSDFTVTDGTDTVSADRLSTGTDDNGFYLAVSDITAADFDKGFTVSCGNLTIGNISVFSYIRQALTATDSSLSETVASIYDYNRAIEAYIAAQQSSQTE